MFDALNDVFYSALIIMQALVYDPSGKDINVGDICVLMTKCAMLCKVSMKGRGEGCQQMCSWIDCAALVKQAMTVKDRTTRTQAA